MRIEVNPDFSGLKAVLEEKFNQTWTVYYDAIYAASVEYGSSPHTPPQKEIKKWVIHKLGVTEKEADSVAWAIVNSIKKHGTAPHPFLRIALNEAKAKAPKLLQKGGVEAIAMYVFSRSQELLAQGIDDTGSLAQSGHVFRVE